MHRAAPRAAALCLREALPLTDDDGHAVACIHKDEIAR